MSILQIRKLRVGNESLATMEQTSNSGLWVKPHAMLPAILHRVLMSKIVPDSTPRHSPLQRSSYWLPDARDRQGHPIPTPVPCTNYPPQLGRPLPTHLFWPCELFLALKRVCLPIVSPRRSWRCHQGVRGWGWLFISSPWRQEMVPPFQSSWAQRIMFPKCTHGVRAPMLPPLKVHRPTLPVVRPLRMGVWCILSGFLVVYSRRAVLDTSSWLRAEASQDHFHPDIFSSSYQFPEHQVNFNWEIQTSACRSCLSRTQATWPPMTTIWLGPGDNLSWMNVIVFQ